MGARPPHPPAGTSTPRLLAPAIELAALGVGLTLTVTLLGRMPSWYRSLGAFQGLYAVAFGFFALALMRAPRFAALPRVGLAVFAVALACRVVLLPVSPSLSGDIHRYVWEGRVVVHGGDPYTQPPDDPALAGLRDHGYPPINHKHLSTIYPPGAMAGFALVAAVSPTVTAFKLWIVLHDLALVALLIVWSRRRGAGAFPAVAYAWNPLVLVEYAGSGHHDPTAAVWLVAAFLLAERRPVLSALALAAGALVKLAPLAALPFLARRWSWRARAAAVVPTVLGLGWFFARTRHPASGVVAYWETWRNNALLFDALESATGRFATARAIALALVASVAAWAWWRRHGAPEATRTVTRAGLLAAPVAHPWYFGWALAFEPLRPSAPWLLLSLMLVLNYGVLATPVEGRAFHLSWGWRCVEYGVPACLAVGLALARRARRTAPENVNDP